MSYLVPAGKGLQFDAGKFVTQHGAEVIEAKDNYNYSRSLLFALAIPYYHTGVRATYSPSDKVTLMGNITNGWNNVSENNSAKTVGAQVMLKPSGKFTFVQNFMWGPEQAGNDDDWRQLYDTIATFTINPKLSVMANYDYGKDTSAGSPVHWQGIAGYLKAPANNVTMTRLTKRILIDANSKATTKRQRVRGVIVPGFARSFRSRRRSFASAHTIHGPPGSTRRARRHPP